jgi:hypothetical protein
MTLPVSGAISFNDINVELGNAGTAQASLNQTSFRELAEVPSGEISLSDFYGKANEFALVFSSNQTNINVATAATAAGWNGSSKLVVTINSGVYVSSTNTANAALIVSGTFPRGVEVTNNGVIVGMGGAGGAGGGSRSAGSAGGAGGAALSVSASTVFTNNGSLIGGGGGGGGGGGACGIQIKDNGPGGGGGGGRSSFAQDSLGGSAGTGSQGLATPGQSGSFSTFGAGGAGRDSGGAGGAGGGQGAAGANGANGYLSGSSDCDGVSTAGGAGGAAGAAVLGNSNITWVETGTRLGPIE